MMVALARKAPYIDMIEQGTELMGFGPQGQFLFDLASNSVIQDCVRVINSIAIVEKMYPEVPWQPLSHFAMDEANAIIIGGMPLQPAVKSWLGIGYSYENKSKIQTTFHKEVIDQLSISKPWLRRYEMNSDNQGLINEDIMLFHNVMSITENDKYNRILQKCWFPIIHMTISAMTFYRPEAPVIFTSAIARDAYKNAVRYSKHVMTCEHGIGASDGTSYPSAYLAMEDLINIETRTANFDLERSIKYGSRREAAY